ncbi:Cysteine synthase 2 [Coccomyxa sp. Obi]|nr:Cysteine synthase 2 [Coccomyxa sp. Obi]
MPVGKDALLIALAAAGLISITNQVLQLLQRWRRGETLFALDLWEDGSCRAIADGVEGLIGDTPLVRIRSLSEQTGCEILAKAEMLNVGGSVKDRVALEVVREAMAEGCLNPGGLITEGTAGSTGVSLAMVAAGRGCRCRISMPDDAAEEKAQLLRALGADVRRVRPVSITHPDHFVNVARREAVAEPGSALFANQFENLANFRAHLRTGREIWHQTRGRLHAFISGAGTGGTIAGISCYLKSQDPRIKVMLVDPPGSSLFNKVKRGVLYAREEAEGKRLRNPFDTITEGIGINRITANFSLAKVDDAFKGSDREAVEMAAYLLHNDGLFVGSSAAMNCVGAVKAARALGKGHTIVTVLCDGGQRHLSKFHNPEYLAQHGLVPQHSGRDLSFVE